MTNVPGSHGAVRASMSHEQIKHLLDQVADDGLASSRRARSHGRAVGGAIAALAITGVVGVTALAGGLGDSTDPGRALDGHSSAQSEAAVGDAGSSPAPLQLVSSGTLNSPQVFADRLDLDDVSEIIGTGVKPAKPGADALSEQDARNLADNLLRRSDRAASAYALGVVHLDGFRAEVVGRTGQDVALRTFWVVVTGTYEAPTPDPGSAPSATASPSASPHASTTDAPISGPVADVLLVDTAGHVVLNFPFKTAESAN
jgi:hypothetical protein